MNNSSQDDGSGDYDRPDTILLIGARPRKVFPSDFDLSKLNFELEGDDGGDDNDAHNSQKGSSTMGIVPPEAPVHPEKNTLLEKISVVVLRAYTNDDEGHEPDDLDFDTITEPSKAVSRTAKLMAQVKPSTRSLGTCYSVIKSIEARTKWPTGALANFIVHLYDLASSTTGPNSSKRDTKLVFMEWFGHFDARMQVFLDDFCSTTIDLIGVSKSRLKKAGYLLTFVSTQDRSLAVQIISSLGTFDMASNGIADCLIDLVDEISRQMQLSGKKVPSIPSAGVTEASEARKTDESAAHSHAKNPTSHTKLERPSTPPSGYSTHSSSFWNKSPPPQPVIWSSATQNSPPGAFPTPSSAGQVAGQNAPPGAFQVSPTGGQTAFGFATNTGTVFPSSNATLQGFPTTVSSGPLYTVHSPQLQPQTFPAPNQSPYGFSPNSHHVYPNSLIPYPQISQQPNQPFNSMNGGTSGSGSQSAAGFGSGMGLSGGGTQAQLGGFSSGTNSSISSSAISALTSPSSAPSRHSSAQSPPRSSQSPQVFDKAPTNQKIPNTDETFHLWNIQALSPLVVPFVLTGAIPVLGDVFIHTDLSQRTPTKSVYVYKGPGHDWVDVSDAYNKNVGGEVEPSLMHPLYASPNKRVLTWKNFADREPTYIKASGWSGKVRTLRAQELEQASKHSASASPGANTEDDLMQGNL